MNKIIATLAAIIFIMIVGGRLQIKLQTPVASNGLSSIDARIKNLEKQMRIVFDAVFIKKKDCMP